MNRFEWKLLALLVAMWITLAVIFSIAEPTTSAGAKHPTLKTMDQGVSSERHQNILVPGLIFGALVVVFLAGMLIFGLRRDAEAGKAKVALFAVTLVYLGVFWMVFYEYFPFLLCEHSVPHDRIPAATLWMLIGLWAAPIAFVALYMWNFKRWIYSDGDEERFQEIVAASRERGEKDA